MRKVFAILTGIFFTFLCTSCEQFTSDIDTYLGYWAAEVSATGYSIDQLQKPYPTNKDGVLCIPSTRDVKVTINLRNPKNFQLVMPTSSSSYAGKVITFPGFSPQPEYGELKDYTLTQTANDKLELKYKLTFLQAHEWGNGDISPEITFITDRRVFRRKFNLNLKVDTAPALEYAGIGKMTVGTDNYYVLLFRVTGMDKTARGELVHKDIKELIVTAGGVPSEIPLSFNAGKTDFETGGDLLAESALHVLDIDHPLPGGNWLLRLKTDVKVGGPEKAYEVCIKDKQGVSSAVISAGTPKNKLGGVKLLDGSTPMAETPASPGESEANPKVFAGMSVKTLTAKAQSGAAITGAIYKKNGSAWTETDTVSGITPVTVNLPALGTGETEALYKITLKARLSGYDDSDSKDFFIKSVRQELPVLKLKQNFNDSNPSLHCISAGTKGYVTEDIIPDAGQYTSTKPLVIYAADSSSHAPSLVLSAPAGAAIKYKLDTGTEQPTAEAVATEIALDSSRVHKLEVWAVKSGVEGLHTTVYFKVKTAVDTYSELKNIVKNAPEKGTGPGQYHYSNNIDIKIGADLTASADTEIAITGGKKLELLSSQSGTVRTVNANNNGRIFKVSGAGTELTLNDIKLMNGKPADNKGGAAYVETGGILVLKGKTVITPSIGSEVNTPGKNDVYLDITKSSSIKVDSALTSTESIVARITPVPYSDTHRVLTGTAVGGEYTKFSITQDPNSTNLWKIKSDGILEAIPSVINGSDSLAWQKLKNAVQNFPNGSIITINGEIKATNEGTAGVDANWGEIVINKNLTIKGKTGAGSDILNANSTTTDPNAPSAKHRIFKVTSGKTLTLKNLTLKNGHAAGYSEDGFGGSIYTKGGTVTMKNCTVTGNQARIGGAVYAESDGSTPAIVKVSGGTIGGEPSNTQNLAYLGGGGKGGGVYIKGIGSSLTLSDNASITGNRAANGAGGGVYVANGARFVLESGTITKCTGNQKSGAGVYVETGAAFKMKGSSRVTPTADDNDVYLKNGSKIELDEALSGGTSVARITPETYTATTQVLDGDITDGTPQNYTKFTVTPKDLGGGSTEVWKINSSGFLQKAPVVINGTGLAWKNLRAAVAAAADGDIIIIDGEIKATNSGSGENRGEIDIAKNITIEKAAGASSAVLNANRDHLDPNARPIFRVSGGKTLTLKNLTLKGGKGIAGTFGGAINVTGGGKAELTNCTIEDCEAEHGGAIGCGSGTTVNLTNTTIKKCKTTGATGTGGAIYAKGATVNMTNCTLTGNKAKNGGAVYAEKNTTPSILATVTIAGGAIGGTGTDDSNKTTGTGTGQGLGGGIYIGGGCTVTLMDGVQVIGNTAVNGGGVYVDINSTFKMSGGTISGNTVGGSGKGSGIYVSQFPSSAQYIMKMSGSAKVDTNNDVYLEKSTYLGNSDAQIKVDGRLTPEGGITARITPQNYTEGTIILSGTKAQENKKKFTITRETSGGTETDWRLTEGTGNEAVLEKAATTFGAYTPNGDFTKIIPPINGITGRDPTYPLPNNALNEKAGVLRAGRIVKLSPYKIGKTAVTYKLWKEVYDWASTNGYVFANTGKRGSDGNGNELEPVVEISWRDCIIWCNAYTEKTMGADECVYRTSAGGTVLKNANDGTACDAAYADMDKKGYRLPTEAEWEYAARWQGGNQTNAEKYGDVWLTRLDSLSGAKKPAAFENTQLPPGESWTSLKNESARVGVFYIWWNGTQWIVLGAGKTSPVGSKDPNYLGLYDMSGNVWEWCFDWYANITGGTETDPQGASSGTRRALRGGTWTSNAITCAVGNRGNEPTDEKLDRLGFRLVCRP